MSFQFKPPVAAESEITWRDLFRLGPEADPFWYRVRATQLDFLARYFPFTLAVAVGNASVVLAALAHKAPPGILVAWMVIQTAMAVHFVRRLIREARSGKPTPATRRYTRQVVLEMGLVGACWGLMFAFMIPALEPSQLALVVGMTLVGIGTTAYSTAVFPVGALALSGPIALGTIAGILEADWPHGTYVLIILGAFLMVIVRGNVLTTFAFLARLKTQDRLLEQEEVVRLLLKEFDANGNEWLFELGRDGCITFATSKFADAVGRPIEEIIGQPWTRFVADPESLGELREIARNGQPFRDLLIRSTVNGELRWWSVSGTPKYDADGRLAGYRGVGSDITDRQKSAERIAELATFDSLTGLVNRRVIHTAIADGLHGPTGVALLFVDLDRFKAINDSLGHSAGDQLLVEVAGRLRAVVGAAGQVGRLGGDEFAIVLRAADAAAATELGEQVIAELSRPFALGGTDARIGASVGLALGPEDGTSVEALMRAADLALYDVKGKGRGTVRRYDREMHARAEARRALELDLRSALEQGQIALVYQPIVDALDERVVGFEALMRWRHPVHGEISPSVFIPIAEDIGIIGQLGLFAIDEALRTAARWPRHIKISVNLSSLQFDQPGLVEDIAAALRRHGVEPRRLELELTESVFLDQRDSTVRTLARLRELGVGFALDDFGTGYSSLGYLQKVEFNRIKIDQSFVRASVQDGNESTAIIQAIIALADRLGMETTAEGTETRAEFEAMRRLGCAQVQGFYFGRPMSAEDAMRHLARSEPLIAIDPQEIGELDFDLADLEPTDAVSPPRSGAEAYGRSPAAGVPPTVPLP
ncbi:MAG: putative bifunctional diguanylate cyclase/phosphodiesterase [Thermaurantiacus tibetensis]